MFTRKSKRTFVSFELELELDRAVYDLKNHKIGSETYEKTLNYVTVLQKLKENAESKGSVSKETMLVVGANLLGILMIIKHENVNVITSKAMNFVIRPR
jgi:hypothetical protein